jgi:hypothetical protein
MLMSPARQGVRRSRRDLHGEVTIQCDAGQWSGQVIDASFSGLRLVRPTEFTAAPGEECHLDLTYGENARMRCRALLARIANDQIAFRFEAPGPHLEFELNRMLAARGNLLDEVAET